MDGKRIFYITANEYFLIAWLFIFMINTFYPIHMNKRHSSGPEKWSDHASAKKAWPICTAHKKPFQHSD